jgi:spore germination protein YaaH
LTTPPTFNPIATLQAQSLNNSISPIAQAAGTDVWPLISGPKDRSAFGQILSNSTLRTQHVTALVKELQAPTLVPGNPVYAGFDINYEGLDTQYHQGFWDFLTDLTNQAHALGKKISVAVGAIDMDGASRSDYMSNPYNYDRLLAIVDFIHIECYDFHSPSFCDPMAMPPDTNNHYHIGPTAPRGWVDDTLQVVMKTVMNTGNAQNAQKFIYGMPNYGRKAKATSGDPTAGHLACDLTWHYASLNQLSTQCDPSTLKLTTDHMRISCFTDPTPPCCWRLNPLQFFDAGRQLNCHQATDPSYTIFFDDLDSLEERLQLAHDKALGGVTYWTVGDELPCFFDMVEKYF